MELLHQRQNTTSCTTIEPVTRRLENSNPAPASLNSFTGINQSHFLPRLPTNSMKEQLNTKEHENCHRNEEADMLRFLHYFV